MRPLLAAVLLLASPALADDLGAFLKKTDAKPVASRPVAASYAECSAQGLQSGGDCRAKSFCHDVESCRRFCCCACDRTAPFSVSPDGKHGWWEEPVYDDKVACRRAPQMGDGMIEPDSDALYYLSNELTGKDADHLLDLERKRATRDVVEGLRRLNTVVANATNKPGGQDVKVRVHNCYRRAIGNHTRPYGLEGNAEAVCGMMFKMMHVENSPSSSEEDKESWRANAQNKWRMTWPGPTPHASGVACDLVLVDAKGDDCFDSGTGKYSKHSCSIKDQLASSFLDEAVTNAGGWRLDFEAWHYEWGGGTECRCQAPDCAKRFYPATGNESQCP